MKLKIKKKIINKSNIINKTGFLFIANRSDSISKKELLINKTKIFKKKTYFFDLYDNKNISDDFITRQFNIDQDDIIHIINIYNKNIKLKLVVIKYNTEIKNLTFNVYLDLYPNNLNQKDTQLYKSIYFYNSNHNNYLSLKLNNKECNIFVKLIDVYYFLIGYI